MDENGKPEEERKKLTIRDFFSMGEVFQYFFRRKATDGPRNINLRLMHGINRLAILIFILSILYFLFKKFIL